MINGENKAGLFAKPRGDRQLLMSTAVWQYQVKMEMRPQSIFAKVMSLFHKNTLQADSFFSSSGSVIDFLFYAPKWTLSSGEAAFFGVKWSL